MMNIVNPLACGRVAEQADNLYLEMPEQELEQFKPRIP